MTNDNEIVYESMLSKRFDFNESVVVCIIEASSSYKTPFCQNVRVQNTQEDILQNVVEDEKVPFLKYHVISRQIFQSTDFIQK